MKTEKHIFFKGFQAAAIMYSQRGVLQPLNGTRHVVFYENGKPTSGRTFPNCDAAETYLQDKLNDKRR